MTERKRSFDEDKLYQLLNRWVAYEKFADHDYQNICNFIEAAVKAGKLEVLERVRPDILGRTPTVDDYMYERAKLELNSKIDALKREIEGKS